VDNSIDDDNDNDRDVFLGVLANQTG